MTTSDLALVFLRPRQSRFIVTTGDYLVDDVLRLFCLTCYGEGRVDGVAPWDGDRECVDCHGFGYV